MESDRSGARFVIGLVLITAGISSLLERAHVFDQIDFGLWWPLVLVVIGLAKLGRRGEDAGGWVLLGLGGWLLVGMFTPLRFGETWPLLIMVWGAVTIWRGLPASRLSVDNEENSHVN